MLTFLNYDNYVILVYINVRADLFFAPYVVML